MKKINKTNIFYILFFIVICIVTFIYSFFLSPTISDEIWSYGFCYNIANRLIPYRDFNMIITPLFALLGSIFINIFGNYLYSVHIFGAIWMGIMMIMLYKIIGWKSFIIYSYLLIYFHPTYNLLCFLWIFTIIYLVNNKKDKYIIIEIITSLCFLTKQTVGLCLFIPALYYSKNKGKSIIAFFIPILLCSIYLIYNNAFYEFIDYCFLGMLDFSEKNSAYMFLLPELIIIIYLLNNLWKSKFKDKNCFYILMFQIIAFPIVDAPHFFIAITPFIYYVINNNINKKYLLYIATFGIAFLVLGINYDIHIVKDNNFMYLRNANLEIMELDEQTKIIKKYQKKYDNTFYILDTAMFLKLYMKDTPNKFDILNNGNFGHKGSSGYIEDIEKICDKNSCAFFMPYWYFEKVEGQLNEQIIKYVKNNYNLIKKYKYFYVYEKI